MAIEFRCSQCNKLLRTGDDTAGRQAKCPECGNIMTVPASDMPPGVAGAVEPLANAGTNGAIAGPAVLEIGDVYGRTWAIFRREWQACLKGWLVVIVLNFVIALVLTSLTAGAGRVLFGERGTSLGQLGNLITQLIGVWLQIGLAIYFIKIARGQEVEIGDLFCGGPYYLNILLALLLFAAIYLVGLMLCIVPGIIAALMFSQFYYLVLDQRLPVLDAFRQSNELTKGNKLTLFVIWLLAVLLIALAAIPCGLGLLVAGPYFTLMFAVIYLMLTRQPMAGA